MGRLVGQNLALQVKLYSPGSTYALQRQLSGLDPGMPGYTTAQRLLSESIQALGPPPATSANNVASTSQVACTDETNCMEGWTCEVQHNTQTYLYTGTFFPNLQWCEAWLNEAWQAYLNFIDEVQDKFNG